MLPPIHPFPLPSDRRQPPTLPCSPWRVYLTQHYLPPFSNDFSPYPYSVPFCFPQPLRRSWITVRFRRRMKTHTLRPSCALLSPPPSWPTPVPPTFCYASLALPLNICFLPCILNRGPDALAHCRPTNAPWVHHLLSCLASAFVICLTSFLH